MGGLGLDGCENFKSLKNMPIFMKMGGDYTWGLHGDEKLIKFLCRADVGLTRLCRVGSSPRNPLVSVSEWGLRGADFRG